MTQNQYPLWRYLLVLAFAVLGALYALPNLYGFDPAVQISARRAAPVDAALEKNLGEVLAKAGIAVKSTERGDGRLLIRFNDDAARAAGMSALQGAVDTRQYLLALNLATATPSWLRALGGKPMYMGLDLRGGVHFLMQVDVDEVRKQTEERFITELRGAFRDKKIRFRSVSHAKNGGVDITFLNAEAKAAGVDLIGKDFPAVQHRRHGVDRGHRRLRPATDRPLQAAGRACGAGRRAQAEHHHPAQPRQ